jgi:hypothetical protein
MAVQNKYIIIPEIFGNNNTKNNPKIRVSETNRDGVFTAWLIKQYKGNPHWLYYLHHSAVSEIE